MACQPGLNPAHLVRAVIVHDQMNLEAGWEIGVDGVEKPQELLMAVPSVAGPDRDTAGHIHRRKQRGHAMPFVIMRLPGRHARSQGEDRLSACT